MWRFIRPWHSSTAHLSSLRNSVTSNSSRATNASIQRAFHPGSDCKAQCKCAYKVRIKTILNVLFITIFRLRKSMTKRENNIVGIVNCFQKASEHNFFMFYFYFDICRISLILGIIPWSSRFFYVLMVFDSRFLAVTGFLARSLAIGFE